MRKLSVNYIGAPSDAAPHGDEYVADYPNLIGYSFDPEDKTLVIEHYKTGNADRRTVTYPESKVIRVTFVNDTVAP